MPRHLHLDLETRSDIDLMKMGVHLYSKSRNTDILCAAYAFDDGPISIWVPGQKVPLEVTEHIEGGGEVHAHNAAFEQHLVNEVGTKRYGWPHIYLDQLVCTMAQAYAMALPGSLEKCAAALELTERKDLEGSRLMKQMCKPRSIEENTGKIIWYDSPEMRTRLAQYCKQDVIVEREIGKRTLRLSDFEKKVWILDQEINNRGVSVDKRAVLNAITLIDDEKEQMQKRIQEISNGEIYSFTSIAQIKRYVEDYGIMVESLDKDSINILLKEKLPPEVEEILKIRRRMGKSSTAKLEPMAFGVDSELRLKGGFQYSGANTRRWSGRRVQLHNMPRNTTVKQNFINDYLEILHTQKLTQALKDELHLFYGSPSEMISQSMRGFITAASGKELVACDFASIEARVLAWLSDQESTLDIFRSGYDIYVYEASRIFGVSKEMVTPEQRQVGKVAILALGYGGGVNALQQMCQSHRLSMAPIFKELSSRYHFADLFKYKDKYGKDLSREEYGASEIVKKLWRRSNPKIVDYWRDVEDAVRRAITEPQTFIVGVKGREVRFKKSGSFLWCKLPSGGVICYPYPELDPKGQITYMSEDSETKKWMRFGTYGGSLVENITQSLARDLLAEAMVNLKIRGKSIVLHVHDEIVVETVSAPGGDSVNEISEIMKETPPWAFNLPIEVTGWRGMRYRK